ncbi:hypothetical protein D9M72_622190 [compost metagenome]
MMFVLLRTWQTDTVIGKGEVPFSGLPHTTVEGAFTSAEFMPSTRAKKSETSLGDLPFSWAPAVTVTLRLAVSRIMDLMLLRPSLAFELARLAASVEVLEQSASLELGALLAHFWATARAAASAPFLSWVRSA